jgi:hypothetical protein
MHALSPISLISFYVLLTLIGVLMLALFVWQVQVLRGKAMMNPDRSVDSWREQRILFGIALADIVIACPLAFAGIALVFMAHPWGILLMAMIAFWMVWINLATTATSLKFERPQITLIWFVTFPFAGLVGLAFLIWIVVHFEAVFAV